MSLPVFWTGIILLGLGVQPPTSDWGSMLAASRQYLNVAPHVAALPGIAIFLTGLGFNLRQEALTRHPVDIVVRRGREP